MDHVEQIKRLDSFINRTTGLGSDADKATHAEIKEASHLHDSRLEDLHRSNAYAGVIVDELVLEATRKGWAVRTEDLTEDLTEDWDDDWDVRGTVAWAAILGRLLGGACIMVVADDGKTPDEPFDPDAPFELKNLVVLDRREVFAHKWDADITSRNFGRPELWRVQPIVNGSVENLGPSRIVHHSRLVYFGGQRVSRRVRLKNRGFDDSVLRRALDAIKNKTSIDQSRAHIVQDFKVDVIKTTSLDSITTADQQLDYFEDRMEIIARSKSNVNLVLLDEGEDYVKNVTSVSGLADLDGAAMDELTTAARFPRTRFVGEAPGGFNTDGESQQRNWNSQVASYQRNELRDCLVQLYRFILGATNGPTDGVVPDSWKIVFHPLEEPTEHQTAALRKTVAETDVLYLDRGVFDVEEVRAARAGEQGWSLDLTTEELPDLELPEGEPIETPATAAAAGAGADVQKSALNGAQVASLLQIVQSSNEGIITPDQAVQIIARAFQMNPADARQLVGPSRADASDEDTYDAPESARNNARQALKWKDEHPKETEGAGTAVGWARARQLASGEKLSRETVGRMAAFARHRKNAKVKPEYKDTPWKDHGYLMWLAWGGDTGINWAEEIVDS